MAAYYVLAAILYKLCPYHGPPPEGDSCHCVRGVGWQGSECVIELLVPAEAVAAEFPLPGLINS